MKPIKLTDEQVCTVRGFVHGLLTGQHGEVRKRWQRSKLTKAERASLDKWVESHTALLVELLQV